jgi:hypothetical protein
MSDGQLGKLCDQSRGLTLRGVVSCGMCRLVQAFQENRVKEREAPSPPKGNESPRGLSLVLPLRVCA